MFSPADWSQYSRAHEGLRITYTKKKLSTELFGAFNQSKENIFETTYSPTGFNNYKTLILHHLKYTIKDKFTLTTINSFDGNESAITPIKVYTRGTSGGRIEYTNKKSYATVAAYYQYGKNVAGKNIQAFYIQPEFKYKLNTKWSAILGAEIMSGDNATITSTRSNSFIPLFGVAHKFMGTMDYFTSFPNDLKNGGLIDPYLFLNFQVHKKLLLRTDFHLFYTENKVLDKNKVVINPYLGFENDLSLKYKPNEYTTIDFGFSYMLAQKSMETIKGGNSKKTPLWSFMSISFKPELFKHITSK